MKMNSKQLQDCITRAMNQEKKALALGDWVEAGWCRAAARVWRERKDVAEKHGYWEHEYEAIS